MLPNEWHISCIQLAEFKAEYTTVLNATEPRQKLRRANSENVYVRLEGPFLLHVLAIRNAKVVSVVELKCVQSVRHVAGALRPQDSHTGAAQNEHI